MHISARTQWALKHLGIDLTHEQAWAFAWLEYWGKQFLVDFGTENAVAKADAHWRVCRIH